MSKEPVTPEELIAFELMRLTASQLTIAEMGSDGASPADVETVFLDWMDKLTQAYEIDEPQGEE